MNIKLLRKKSFPFVKQRDLTECGTTCLAIIFKYYGMYNLQHTLRRLAHVNREGTSLLTLSEIAETFGFNTHGYRLSIDLISDLPLPCIAHYEGNHFVVIYKTNKKSVWIANPASGKDRLSRQDFTRKWNGIVLTLEPTNQVFKQKDLKELIREQREAEKNVLRKHYLSILNPFKQVLAEILAISFILQMLGLALPFFAQNIIDRVLVYQDKKLLTVILLGMLGVFLAQVVFTYVRNILLAQFKVSFELHFFSNFFNHFIHLNQSYFDSHRREDFINRFQENLRIRRILSPAILQSFIDLIFVINLVVVMFFYQKTLATVGLGFVLLMVLMTGLFTPKLRKLENKVFYDNLESMQGFLDTLLGMQTVKLLALEKLRLWEWRNVYTKGLNRVLASEQVYASLQSILRGIFFISQITVYWIGAQMAFKGDLSIGQYIAFIGIFTATMMSFNNILPLWGMVTEISISYSRLNDILMTKPERMDLLELRVDIEQVDKIELKDLCFRYSEDSARYALRDINLTISHGENLAIVGRNGSGKTTLAKLLIKLYQDYTGKIELKNVHPRFLRKKIVLLPQVVYLFSGTIHENISYGNPEASIADVIEAAKLADIHQVIQGLYLGYNHIVSEYSNIFSGGEKLKIAFARLFLSNAEVIILDEASSALDVETESIIMGNVRKHFKGKTIISIAHRLHTARAADRIIVLDRGSIAETGNHRELLDRKGIYHQFVTTYLEE
jgi:ABC-type bacteriocin/lantibiotic exporter with double-glycine peptidase domain